MLPHRNSSFNGPSRRPVARRGVPSREARWGPSTPARPSGRRQFLGGQALTTRAAVSRIAVVVLAVACGPSALGRQPSLSPGQAIAQARPGETILIAPGVYHDCAVEHANHVTIGRCRAGGHF